MLAPGDTTVGFRFAALSFTSPELNRYAYRMDGFDTAWIDAGTRRTTRYTNLPPGLYRFRVRGSNNDGVWNSEGTSLEVIVHPTLWETWWFRPIVVFIIVGATWAAYRFRAGKKREMERLRIRIAGKMLEMFARMAEPRSAADDYGLTTRELEILELLVESLTVGQFAERLGISFHTVDSHTRNIYAKLHVRTRTAAVAKTLKERLI